jgi:hypothetical protein
MFYFDSDIYCLICETFGRSLSASLDVDMKINYVLWLLCAIFMLYFKVKYIYIHIYLFTSEFLDDQRIINKSVRFTQSNK